MSECNEKQKGVIGVSCTHLNAECDELTHTCMHVHKCCREPHQWERIDPALMSLSDPLPEDMCMPVRQPSSREPWSSSQQVFRARACSNVEADYSLPGLSFKVSPVTEGRVMLR